MSARTVVIAALVVVFIAAIAAGGWMMMSTNGKHVDKTTAAIVKPEEVVGISPLYISSETADPDKVARYRAIIAADKANG